jgi:hypothetical protein
MVSRALCLGWLNASDNSLVVYHSIRLVVSRRCDWRMFIIPLIDCRQSIVRSSSSSSSSSSNSSSVLID